MAGLNREYFNCVQLNITNLANILFTLTQTYRLLVGGAEEFARIGLAPKHDKEEAIDRADDMGDIIDKFIKKLDCQTTIFLQLFEPEIICALPSTTTPSPTATPCPTTTQSPTEASTTAVTLNLNTTPAPPTATPAPTATPTSRQKLTMTAEAIIEFEKALEEYQNQKELKKDIATRVNSEGSTNKEEKDEVT